MNFKQKLLSILENNPKFSEDLQGKIGRDRSIVYGVYFLEENNIEATFQRICITCFYMFPESFSFVEFPEYPDSRIVRNCIWHCTDKSKSWLVGSDKTYYNITDKARDEVLPIFRKLIDSNMDAESLPYLMKIKGKKKDPLFTKPRDKEVSFYQGIKKSKGFRLYQENRDQIKSVDIKNSLGGDRYVSEVFLSRKWKEAFGASELIGDKDVKKYLEWIKENWSKYVK